MGGKNKPNRTKNNAKPSSSARSAELLSNQTSTIFGFGTIKDGTISMLNTVPTQSSNEELDPNIDVNFQLALKKMTKKDPITKIKALQEFSELCKKAEVANVKAVLPTWSRLYNQLCSETEHRVREAAHNSHKEVILKVKKQLAPFLKEIIGPWFTSQYDTYAPAASACQASFQVAFSPTKMAEAISFCQTEILNFLQANLIILTPQSLATSKNNTPDELDEKYRRIVSSSLLGYASYFEIASSESLKTNEEANKKIINSGKFWKLAQHKDPIIRHAFFSTILSLLQHAPWFVTADAQKVVSCIFNHLSEDDPLVLPVVWDSALVAVIALPECENLSIVEKQLIPKLFQFLRTGGKGHARTIFPKVLPLLSGLPANKIKDLTTFYDQLFSSFKSGLMQSSVNRSASEGRVIANTFVETLQYMVMLNRDSSSVIRNLIEGHLMTVIETYLPLTNLRSTWDPLCHFASKMVQTWYKNSPEYDEAAKIFWVCLRQLFESTLKAALADSDVEIILKNQSYLLTTLRNPRKQLYDNFRQVKLASKDEETEEVNSLAEEPSDIGPENYLTSLTTTVNELVLHYIDCYTSSMCKHYLVITNEIGRVYGSSCLDLSAQKLNLFQLFVNGFLKDMPQDVSRRLGFLILPLLKSEEEQCNILTRLVDRADFNHINFCNDLLLCKSPIVKIWMQKEEFSNIFTSVVNNFLDLETIEDTKDLIWKCLGSGAEPLVNKVVFHKIVHKMLITLSDPKKTKSHTKRISLVLTGFGNKHCIELGAQFDDLFIAIFCAACQDEADIMDDLLRDALYKYKICRFSGYLNVLSKMALHLSSSLDFTSFTPKKTLKVVSEFFNIALDVNLWETCDPEEIEKVVPLVECFLQPSASVKGWCTDLKNLSMLSLEVNGLADRKYLELKKVTNQKTFDFSTCNKEESGSINHLIKVDMQAYTNWLHFSVELLQLFFSAYPLCIKFEEIHLPGRYVIDGNATPEVCEDPDVISREVSQKQWEQLNADSEVASVFDRDAFPNEDFCGPIRETILEIVHAIVILDSLLQNYPEMEHHHHSSQQCQQLMIKLRDALATCTPEEFLQHYQMCMTFIQNNPSWWAVRTNLSTVFYRRFLMDQDVPSAEDISCVIAEITSDTGLENNPHRILLLNAIVKNYAHWINLDDWSKISIQLEKAMKFISKLTSKEENLWQSSLVSSFFLISQDIFLNCLKRSDNERLLPETVQLWNDVVEKELWRDIYSHWLNLLPLLQPKPAVEEPLEGSQLVATSLDINIQLRVLIRRISEAIAAGLCYLPPAPIEDTISLAEQCSALVLSNFSSLQLLCYRILLSLVPELVKEDNVLFQKSVADTPKNEDVAFFSRVRECDWTLKCILPSLEIAKTVVAALLSDLKLGDTCTIEPFSDSFTFAHGFLLLWGVIVEMMGEAHVALRFQYAAWLKNTDQLHTFLNSTFNLMPASIVHYNSSNDTSTFFNNDGNVSFAEPPCSEWIEHRACYLYRMCLQRLPAAVRAWWNEKDNVARNVIAKTTTQHISPLLIAAELQAVQSEAMQMDNLLVTVAPTARTVVGSYGSDEIQIILTLPANHPLGLIDLDMKTKTSFSQAQALRVYTFLVHRNGSISDALAMWKTDMDKKLEGIEECEICFSILNGPNHELPKQACNTCRKKFHSACLYKWFQTSYKSSCPHCRNQF